MHSSLPTATKKHIRKFMYLSEIGCVACLSLGYEGVPCDIHHILRGGRRVSHDFVVGLCCWHHRGIPPEGMTNSQAETHTGPSLAHNKKAFIKAFGTEQELYEISEQLYKEATK